MKKSTPRAPIDLGAAGKALWRGIQANYRVDDPGGLSLLLTACRTEDDLQRMRARVAKEGDTVTDRFGQIQPHPLLSAIRGSEQVKRQALRGLNLDIEPLRERPGRPGGR